MRLTKLLNILSLLHQIHIPRITPCDHLTVGSVIPGPIKEHPNPQSNPFLFDFFLFFLQLIRFISSDGSQARQMPTPPPLSPATMYAPPYPPPANLRPQSRYC